MPHRLLVVDDEKAIRDLLQDYLESRGYRVVVAADGEEGIRRFHATRPQLAVIDFLLPKKNGFAVADAVRRSELSGTPIIMMSGVFKNPKTAVEAHEKYQVLDFLSKPLDLPTLEGLIRSTLAGVEPASDLEPAELEPPTGPVAEEPPARHASLRLQSADDIEPVTAAGDRPGPRGLSYVATAGGAVFEGPKRSSPAGEIVNGVFHGRPFPELDDEGAISSMPVALLLSTIRYDQVTGMLDMNNESGTHRRIYIIDGNPTFMQSNAESENVGALLLSRGRITEPDFERCLRYMKDRARTLQQSLLEMRLVTEADLATAYKLLAGQLLPLAIGMSTGTYRWRESDAFVGRVPEGRFEPVQVLFEGIKRHVHPPQILKFFTGREDVSLVPTREFAALMPYFQRVFGADNVAADIDGHRTYRQLTRMHAIDAAVAVPQLFALVTSGMIVLPQVSEENALEVAVNVAAAEIENLGLDDDGPIDLGLDDEGASSELTASDRKAQLRVERYHGEIMSLDFFQIFRATSQTSEDDIKTAYFELAKRWHADAFAERNLGPHRRLLDEIFARITEAYETITDPARRSEYLVYLDRKAKGLPTDVNEILRGEQLFDQATAMIRRRDYANAQQVLEEATRLNPDPIYFATLGWVVFNLDVNLPSNLSRAVQLLRRAIQEQENLPVAYQYLGSIAHSRQNFDEARKWWQRCLEWEPGNIEAARGLRLLSSRHSKQSSGSRAGLLSKVFKK